jgi:hypothetical protein
VEVNQASSSRRDDKREYIETVSIFIATTVAAMMMMVTAIVSTKMVFIAIQRLAIVMAMGETFVFSRVEPELRQTR